MVVVHRAAMSSFMALRCVILGVLGVSYSRVRESLKRTRYKIKR